MFRGTENQRLWSTTNSGIIFPDDRDKLKTYNEHADLNLWEEKTEIDDEVEEFIDWLTADYWDVKFEGALNLKHVVVTGRFQKWDGPHDILPTLCKDLKEAVDKCCSISGDFDADLYFEKDENGWEHLIVGISHHDDPMGNTRYEISLLVNYDEIEEDDDPEKYKLKAITHKMVFG